MKNTIFIVVLLALIVSNIIFAVGYFRFKCDNGHCSGCTTSGTAAAVAATPIDAGAEKIALVAPSESGSTILQALQARASVRNYTSDKLTLEQLSGVMWAAAGENRPGVNGAPGYLTAPSAMALYPTRTYAVLPEGVYLYDAPTHSLSLVVAGDFRELTGLQDFAYTAPLNIMYIADLSVYDERMKGMSEYDIMHWCYLDAAGYCENANLWAAGNGLGAVTRAGAKSDAFLAAINAPSSYRFVLAQTIGVPAEM